jgi:hypothetical protein
MSSQDKLMPTEEMGAQRKAVQRVLVLISRNRPSVEDTNTARRELNAVLAWFNAMHEARPTADVSTDGLVERLRDADRGSVQRSLGSRIFGEAADRIEALQRSNAEKDEALRRISAPLGNPPEKQDGDKAETIIRFWRGVAVRCREIARKALEDREIG